MKELKPPYQIYVVNEDELRHVASLLEQLGLKPRKNIEWYIENKIRFIAVPDKGQLFGFNITQDSYPSISIQELENHVAQVTGQNQKTKYKEFLAIVDSNYILQTLTEHKGDDPDSGLIEVPEGAEVYVHFTEPDHEDFIFYKDNFKTIWQDNYPVPYWDKCIVPKKELLNYPHQILWLRDREDTQLGLTDFHTTRTASDISDAALKHIRERAQTYDSPEGERSATKTAQAFNAITGKDLTEAEVFLLLQILKDVRQWQKQDYHQDSAEDAIAYAALKAEALERV